MIACMYRYESGEQECQTPATRTVGTMMMTEYCDAHLLALARHHKLEHLKHKKSAEQSLKRLHAVLDADLIDNPK